MALLQEIEEYFQINGDSLSHALVWDAMKAVVRGLYIREISRHKSKTRELTVTLQNRVSDTEAQFVCNPTDSTKANWIEAQSILKDHMLHMADNK